MFGILSLKGTADRSEWWTISMVSGVVAQVAVVFALVESFLESEVNWVTVFGLTALAVVASWTAVAVTARRFRDRGDSAWMTLLLAVPILGEIWVVIVCGFLRNPNEPKRKVVVRRVSHRSEPQKAEQDAGDQAPAAVE